MAKVFAAMRFGSFSSEQKRIFWVLNSFDMTWNAAKAVPVATISMAPPFVTEACMGNLSLLSNDQQRKDRAICLRLFMHRILQSLGRCCLAREGRMSPARIERQATTINSSKTVNASG